MKNLNKVTTELMNSSYFKELTDKDDKRHRKFIAKLQDEVKGAPNNKKFSNSELIFYDSGDEHK